MSLILFWELYCDPCVFIIEQELYFIYIISWNYFAVFDEGKLKVYLLHNNALICCCAWWSECYSPYVCSCLIVSVFVASHNFLVFCEKVSKIFLQIWCYWQFSKLYYLWFDHSDKIYGFFELSIVDWFRKLNLWSILSVSALQQILLNIFLYFI